MADPRIFLCIGATKAGTSWLYSALSGHPEVHLRGIKELHYFDTIDAGKTARRIDEVTSARDRLLRKADGAGFFARRRLKARIADHDAYLAVLSAGGGADAPYLNYLREGAGRRAVVGDVTPAYALLSRERLAQMAAMAPDVRFVYLLRDPVDRLWSHVRMMAVRRAPDRVLTRARADTIFRRTLAGKEDQIEIRCDYRRALDALFAAVAPSRRHLSYYEDLFEGPGLSQICTFLGIAPIPAPQEVVHGGQTLEMRPEQRAEARVWLDAQYEHVGRVMGQLHPRWQPTLAKV
ncbi:MAG: sulfotransferase [Pseudomonadota bacterium]